MIHFLKVGSVVINLAHVTDVELQGRMSVKGSLETVPCVAITVAVSEGDESERYGRFFQFTGDEAESIREFVAKAKSSAVVNVLDIMPAPEPADNSILVETKEGMIRFVPTPA